MTPQELKKFIKKNAGSMSGKDMAKATGYSYGSVAVAASNMGVSLKRPIVSDEDITYMRWMYEEYNVSAAALARKFKISPQHAWAICNYKSRLN
ncbi:TPA: hypothetical protein ACX3EJ_001076 [Vibrio parahaemolyticus]